MPGDKQMMSAIEEQLTSADDYVTTMNDVVNRTTAAHEVRQELLSEYADNEQLIKEVEVLGELDVQQRKSELLRAGGGDEILRQMAGDSYNAYARLQKEQAELQANIDHDSGGNPISWLGNFFEKLGNRYDVEDAKNTVTNTANAFSAFAATQERGAKIIDQTKRTTNLASMQATLSNINLAYKEKAIVTELQMIQANGQQAKLVYDASRSKLDSYWKGQQMRMDKERFQWARTEHDQRVAEHKLQIQILEDTKDLRDIQTRKAELDLTAAEDTFGARTGTTITQYEELKSQIADKENRINAQITALNTSLARLGSPLTINRSNLEAFVNSDEDGAKELIAQGLVAYEDGDGGKVSSNVGDAALLMAKYNPKAFEDTSNSYLQLVKKVMDQAAALVSAKQLKEEGLAEYIATNVEQRMADLSSEVVLDDVSNPNHPASKEAIIAANPTALEDNQMWQTVLKDGATSNMDPSHVMMLAQEYMAAGNIAPEQAADELSEIFKLATEHNNISQKRNYYGGAQQTELNMRVTPRVGTGGTDRETYFDPALAAARSDLPIFSSMDNIINLHDPASILKWMAAYTRLSYTGDSGLFR